MISIVDNDIYLRSNNFVVFVCLWFFSREKLKATPHQNSYSVALAQIAPDSVANSEVQAVMESSLLLILDHTEKRGSYQGNTPNMATSQRNSTFSFLLLVLSEIICKVIQFPRECLCFQIITPQNSHKMVIRAACTRSMIHVLL